MSLKLKLIFLVTPFIILLFANFNSYLAQQKSKQKKVLFVYGGWDGHQPKECKDLLVPWLEEQGYDLVVSNTLDSYTDSLLMSSVNLIIQTFTMAQITGEQEKGLTTAIKNGAAIAGWHGGLGDAFRNNPEYQFMVGGQWVAHPGGKVKYEVNIVNTVDPITKGLSDFEMNSEQYFMHVDPSIEVLATTKFNGENASWIDGTVMPVVWKKKYGKGNVFYSSLGHSVSDFEVPEAITIMKRGILWAIGDL
ncbi:MAG: ThuA domain-containing protein [Ignavibacteriae bacterium]|nr:ThuA domain-containing protein [Ignavibacteriota bacterium]